jgi:helicase
MDADPQDALRFASIFFDAYLNADLDAELTSEFSLLCAAAYYIAGNVGSAAVIVRHMAAPELEIAGGLGYLLYAILRNEFVAIEAAHAHQAVTSPFLEALARFFRFEGDSSAVADRCSRMRGYFHSSAHRASCFTAISSEPFARSSCAMRRAPSWRPLRASIPSYGVTR